jgi:hypothetical protein
MEEIQETIDTSVKDMIWGKGQIDTTKPLDFPIVPKVTLITMTVIISISWLYLGCHY